MTETLVQYIPVQLHNLDRFEFLMQLKSARQYMMANATVMVTPRP